MKKCTEELVNEIIERKSAAKYLDSNAGGSVVEVNDVL